MISLCSWQLAGRVDVIAAVAEWGLDIVIPATTEAVTVTRTCSSPSSFSHSVHLKMMESYHKMSRLGKASSVLSTCAFSKMSSHTKLVPSTEQLIPSASSHAFHAKCHGDTRTRLMRNCTHLRLMVVKKPGHLTFSPGIYCEHWVCCGFEVLQSCEFPKHPFQILVSFDLKYI